jgi:purine operon repressor
MKKLKRGSRLIEMTQFLLQRPHTLIPLTTFADRYQSAKSSISEDIVMIKELFEDEGLGEVLTIAGAAGGVKYVPRVAREEAQAYVAQICAELGQAERVLPGGYLYMSDLLGRPQVVREAGKLFATVFADRTIDVIMTVETKGIPLAYATASFLNVPVVIVRRDAKVTEGSAVSINYISGSAKRIQTMSLARRLLRQKARVLIIDDYIKAGGTVRGMVDLLDEFEAELVGVGIFAESGDAQDRLVDDVISLVKLEKVDERARVAQLTAGNFLEQLTSKQENDENEH